MTYPVVVLIIADRLTIGMLLFIVPIRRTVHQTRRHARADPDPW